MTSVSRSPPRGQAAARSAVAVALVLAAVGLVPQIASHGGSPAGAPSAPLLANASVQWAYGGFAHNTSSCSSAHCFGGNLSNNTTITFGWTYAIGWVVIYTETNVSPTQTELDAKAAMNVSLTYTFSSCTNLTPSGPCSSTTESLSLSGTQFASGSTNFTNGTVLITSGPGASTHVPAWAVANASSNEAFNFSGNLALSSSVNATTESASFDVGASEHSAIAFAPPLGLVPVSPSASQAWTASAPFTATGSYAAGYSYSASVSGSPTIPVSNWKHGSVATSGTLTVNGSDLGPQTLWDNYSTPHRSSSAHEIDLAFSGANFSAIDGCIFGPTDLYSSLLGSFNGSTNATQTVSETTFYAPGQGFVGASLSGNASNASGMSGLPTVSLQAGPEPVGVAEQQYAAIAAGPSSSSDWVLLLVAGVVVAAVGATVGVLLWRRRVHRRPPAQPFEPSASGVPPAAGGPGQGT